MLPIQLFPIMFLPLEALHSSGLSKSYLIPAIISLALVNHVYFHRFEPKTANWALIALLIQPPFLLLAFNFSTPLTLFALFETSTIFIVTLCLSIVTYRLSPWHPLAHVPGPTINKVTKLWAAYIASTGRQHRVNRALHDRYGPIVRTGPNEVSIIHVDAIKAVLGVGGYQKGQFYDAQIDPYLPTRSMLSLRGEEHSNRRRRWNRGMGLESIKDYESILSRRITHLIERLGQLGSRKQGLNLAAWFSYFSFDFMGDMAFGGGFEMVRDGGDKDGIWTMIEQGSKYIAIVSHIPWIVPLLYKIPGATRGLIKLRTFSINAATKRMKAGPEVKDLWYHLMDEAGMEKQKPGFDEVVADGVLSIVAGSDTAAVALSSLVWFLLSNPEMYRRVQAEVDAVFPEGETTLDSSKHSELQFLTACLNETLRMHPAVATRGPRKVGPGGAKVIAGCFIPDGTQIFIPPYSLHHNSEYFYPNTDVFYPDRWLRAPNADKDEVRNDAAFIPFSFGPANCVGKALAWREMLMVASTLFKTFELRFADGFESEGWVDRLKDVLVTGFGGPLMVQLSRR